MCASFFRSACPPRTKWIRLFDFYSGKCLAKVAGHSELATGVRFTSDGRRLVTIGGGRTRAGLVRSIVRPLVRLLYRYFGWSIDPTFGRLFDPLSVLPSYFLFFLFFFSLRCSSQYQVRCRISGRGTATYYLTPWIFLLQLYQRAGLRCAPFDVVTPGLGRGYDAAEKDVARGTAAKCHASGSKRCSSWLSVLL